MQALDQQAHRGVLQLDAGAAHRFGGGRIGGGERAGTVQVQGPGAAGQLEAGRLAAKFGPGHGIEARGVDRPIEWSRASLTEVFLYVPYQLTVVPAED